MSLAGSCRGKGVNECVTTMSYLLDPEPRWACNMQRNAAIRFLREATERQGVYVYAGSYVGSSTNRPLRVGEFRGVVPSNRKTPVIFLDTSDACAGLLPKTINAAPQSGCLFCSDAYRLTEPSTKSLRGFFRRGGVRLMPQSNTMALVTNTFKGIAQSRSSTGEDGAYSTSTRRPRSSSWTPRPRRAKQVSCWTLY
ncbi:hypothetical protein ADJ70_04555 [Olsenella sp. oral taxon 807]|uniref:hypothetical protein n=1 Tax=Olsenella sp. oral taxon 807 TaxID=712411 RepID=UPI000679F849|nr:hypothetical protein [Olsenella sp. oral taxon 807]AKT48390.1 hypothetical protein ADJ70_04555 [Olsenella sp. oral taxon 807]